MERAYPGENHTRACAHGILVELPPGHLPCCLLDVRELDDHFDVIRLAL